MQTLYTQLKEMLDQNKTGLCGLVVEGDQACPSGTKFLLNAELKIIAGNLEENLLNQIKDDLAAIIQNRKPIMIELPSGLKMFIDLVYPQIHLVVFGGGHIALPLVKFGKLMDYKVTVFDDRPDFANPERFAEADEVICDRFEKAFQRICIDQNTYVVIVTRGHLHDQLCLEGVLKSSVNPAYVGMIGSRRKVMTIMDSLRERGFSEGRLTAVSTPIGLDIGAQTPAEISLSILSEIVMIQHYGNRSGINDHVGRMKFNG